MTRKKGAQFGWVSDKPIGRDAVASEILLKIFLVGILCTEVQTALLCYLSSNKLSSPSSFSGRWKDYVFPNIVGIQ